MLGSRVRRFVEAHREKREKARQIADEFVVADISGNLTKRKEAC
jgi:hypothetical protein